MNMAIQVTHTTIQNSRAILLGASIARGTPSNDVSSANRSRMSPNVMSLASFSVVSSSSALSDDGLVADLRCSACVEFSSPGLHIGFSSVDVWSTSSTLSVPTSSDPVRLITCLPFIEPSNCCQRHTPTKPFVVIQIYVHTLNTLEVVHVHKLQRESKKSPLRLF